MNVPFPGQLGFLPGEEDTCSAVELLAGVLASAAAGNRERLVADRPLLDACARFARAGGEEGIRIDRIAGSGGSVHVRASDAKIIEQLRDEIPAPRAVRVTGTLDTVSASSTKIILQLPDDKKVPAQLKNPDAEQLRDLINTRVVISGRAQFGLSGRLLFVDAEHIGPAGEGDTLWERVPTPRPELFSPVATPVPQWPGTGVGAFFGIWPGDESEEELLHTLKELE